MSHSPSTAKTKQTNEPTSDQAVAKLWRLGKIYWKLDANQLSMRDFIVNADKKINVIVASRQMGKSFFLSCVAIEECLKRPNYLVKFIAPEVGMVRNILEPVFREILEDCPDELRPKYKPLSHQWIFPNGSVIHLAGTDSGHAENMRGSKAHLCIIDEAGFCSDLKYIINSILIPTTTTTKGKIILSTTPPKNGDHDFNAFWDQAISNDTLLTRTIYDNPRLTTEEINVLADAMGGIESIDFRREYLCHRITSMEDAVIPEFIEQDLRNDVIKEHVRPAYYDSYAAMDVGGKDLTVVLFAYYDFKEAKLVIEDELVMGGKEMLTEELARLIKQKEETLWKNPFTGEVKPPILRVSDYNNLILLNDIQIKHGLTFLPTDKKDGKEAALNHLRQLLKSRKIVINPRCKTLINHLQNGVWNKARNSYMRTKENGHYDAIDACVYLCRAVNFNKNPYPPGFEFSGKKDIFFGPKYNKNNTFHDQLKEMFTVKRRSRINK